MLSPEVFNSGCILELPGETSKMYLLNSWYFVKAHWMMLIWSQGQEQVISYNAIKWNQDHQIRERLEQNFCGAESKKDSWPEYRKPRNGFCPICPLGDVSVIKSGPRIPQILLLALLCITRVHLCKLPFSFASHLTLGSANRGRQRGTGKLVGQPLLGQLAP